MRIKMMDTKEVGGKLMENGQEYDVLDALADQLVRMTLASFVVTSAKPKVVRSSGDDLKE